jgi:GDP-mannose 6-dehydrogenase
MDVEMPVISSILTSNTLQVSTALDQVLDTGKLNVGLLGFSFKAGTDDLRESPLVTLAEALLGKGVKLRIYDKNVLLSRLVGANKEYIDHRIPHLSSLLCPTIDEVLSHAEVIIVGNKAPEFVDALHRTRPDQIIIDLVRLSVDNSRVPANYRGICW